MILVLPAPAMVIQEITAVLVAAAVVAMGVATVQAQDQV